MLKLAALFQIRMVACIIFIITRGNIIPLFEGGCGNQCTGQRVTRGGGGGGKKGGFCTQKSSKRAVLGTQPLQDPLLTIIIMYWSH